jgi:hypothetical protein
VKKASYDKYRNSRFDVQFATDRAEQLTRFAVRKVAFANVAANWDTVDPPCLHVELFNNLGGGAFGPFESVFLMKFALNFKAKTFDDLVLGLNSQYPLTSNGVVLYQKIGYVPPSASALHSWFGPLEVGSNKHAVSLTSALTGTLFNGRVLFARTGVSNAELNLNANSVIVIHTNESLKNSIPASVVNGGTTYSLVSAYPSVSPALPEALEADTAQSILGFDVPVTLSTQAGYTTDYGEYVYNLNKVASLYLCSQRLSGTSRAYETMRAPVKQAICSIPVSGQMDSFISYEPMEPTVFIMTADEQLSSVDFSLRYPNGNLVELGANSLEIELEVETVDISNNNQTVMEDSIRLPRFNVYDTQVLLGSNKKRTRSYGSRI